MDKKFRLVCSLLLCRPGLPAAGKKSTPPGFPAGIHLLGGGGVEGLWGGGSSLGVGGGAQGD